MRFSTFTRWGAVQIRQIPLYIKHAFPPKHSSSNVESHCVHSPSNTTLFTVASVGKRWVATNDGRRRHRPSLASSSEPRRDFSDMLSSSKELSSDSSLPGLGSASRETNRTGTQVTLRYNRIALLGRPGWSSLQPLFLAKPNKIQSLRNVVPTYARI